MSRVFVDDGTLLNPPWFQDERLTIPGKYKLAVIFSDDVKYEDPRRNDATGLLKADLNGVVSPTVQLNVEHPAGSNAAVCGIARKLAHSANAQACPAWFLYAGVDDLLLIWRQYRDATYARYIAAIVPATTEQRMLNIRIAIAKDPDSDLADWNRLKLARLEDYAWNESRANGSPDAAAHADNAVTLYRQLTQSGRTPEIRRRATEAYDNFESIRSLHGVR